MRPQRRFIRSIMPVNTGGWLVETQTYDPETDHLVNLKHWFLVPEEMGQFVTNFFSEGN